MLLMSKGSKVVFVAFTQHCIQSNLLLILLMLKGSKEALTVLIVIHATHVERVKSGVCGLCTQYRYIKYYVNTMSKQGTNTFLLLS